MIVRRRIASCLLAATLLAAGSAHAQPSAHHATLFYLSEEDLTPEAARPLIAYVDDGPEHAALDWMFDTMIVFSIDLHLGGEPPEPADVTSYEEQLFGEGEVEGQLRVLARTVADMRTELGVPDHRLRIYLAAPYVGGVDAIANTQSLIDQWEAADLPQLELVGFYWGYEEGLATDESADRIRRTVDHAHAQGYEMLWLPLYHASWLEGWLSGCASCGFDDIGLQVGYAFNSVGTERFAVVDGLVLEHGLSGTVIEVGPVRNDTLTSDDPERESAMTYVRAIDHYNWGGNPVTAYYHGSIVSDYAAGAPSHRAIYDGLYRGTTLGSTPPAADMTRIEASADTFVEQLEGYRDEAHGDDTYLNLGTNESGNALRPYLRFDVPETLRDRRVLAAHVHLYSAYYPYGDAIEDVLVHRVDEPSWDEATLTAETQPGEAGLTEMAVHRFAEADRRRHDIDVTAELRDALGAGDSALSFTLRRRTEDATAAEVQLHSRESTAEGGARVPVLRVIHRERPDVSMPDGGVPADAGAGAGDDAAVGDSGTGDSGSARDASGGGDGGTEPPGDGGCGCGTAGRDAPAAPGTALVALVVLGLLRRSRRSGARPGSGS